MYPIQFGAVKLSSEEIKISESQVNLTCEMSDYIRPDKYLQWVDEKGSILKDSKKYRILFEDRTAQNNSLLSSRLSTLTIFNPTELDSGRYSCRVLGSSQPIHTSLIVKPVEDGERSIIITTSCACA